MELSLVRDALATVGQTFGLLYVPAQEPIQTIERPWVPSPSQACGTNGISCIPPGRYALEPHDSEAHPQTWALVNHDLGVYHLPGDVPAGCGSRTAVLLHTANCAYELRGCIAPGLQRGTIDGHPAVLRSKDAFDLIKSAVPWTAGHYLTIVYREATAWTS